MDVLVTGGTGVLGSRVVERLRRGGHRARVLSRRPGGGDRVVGDLATGEGLAEAVRGMEVVVHAGSATAQQWKARATDVEGTARLLEAARAAGVRHFVHVSIVGIDRLTANPYYRHKLAAEERVRAGGVPWSILRATQFHALLDRMLGALCALPGLALVPRGWRFQPVDADEVAARLVEAAAAPPAGMLPDMGGPGVRALDDLARAWLDARGRRAWLARLPVPGAMSRGLAAGALLSPDHRDGRVTWEQYLDRTYGRRR
ncbi:MAG TPA: NAD(P)H-binding protein [Longimicrobiaceae bacterium]|nr:NAD(P)H-binding protein [Longimicrobiaceae bacterium]